MTTGTTRRETARTVADPVAAAAAVPARLTARTAGEATGATDRAGPRRAARAAGAEGGGGGAQRRGTAPSAPTPSARGTSGQRGRNTTSRSGPKKKGTNRKGSAGKAGMARGRQAARTRPPSRSHDPVVILVGWVARAVAGAWMVVAGGFGFLVRSIGRGAKDLDPHHRRDGLGLLIFGAAIVLAASLWTKMDNAVGHGIRAVAIGGVRAHRR